MTNLNVLFDSTDDLKDSLSLLDIVDSSSTLIQVFCASAEFESVEKIHNFFKNHFSHSIIIGTTTDGIINNSTVYADSKSLVSFTTFNKTRLKSILLQHQTCYNFSYETGKSIAQKLIEEDTKAIISFTDGINTNGEEYLTGISEINNKVTVSGGLSADNGKLERTFIFDNNSISSNGAVAVALNSTELRVSTNYTFEWMPIGKKLKVTKAVKNRIYEVDNISVVAIYEKYMGKDLAEELPKIGIEFPLIFEKDGVTVGRAPLIKHKDGSMTFAGNIEEGESVRFGVGNIEMILRNGDYNIKQMFNKTKYIPEALFVYSCMARRRFLNEYVEEELENFQSFGNMSGFFTYGEFYSSENRNQLLNQTMTVLALSEDDVIPYTFLSKSKFTYTPSVNPEHVIAHLANAVSNELAELNENLEQRVKESSAYIYKQAYFDKLTSLPNRLSLLEALDNSMGKVLFLINIDDFTIINDFYGHDIGDKVLIHIAEFLTKYAEDKNAKVFKLPSDEYAIIIDIPYNKDEIELELKQIIAKVEKEEFVYNGNFTHVSITLSAAYINKKRTGLINADMSLKLAKKASKDFMIFAEDLQLAQQYENNIKIAQTIKDAIHEDRIVPYFQAIYDVKTLKIEKYEALVRLIKKDKEVLSPFRFLDISQKIRLYPQITQIMIEKTFSMFELNGENFSINLAFSDITNTRTREFLFEKIVEYNIANQLTIEILETQEIDDSKIMFDFIEEIYKVGAIIAIDDFGSGFANFEYMTKIRCDFMKIDGSLIKNIDKDANARLVVETIVVFAQKLNKKTIAEFVHSKEVYDVVKELGIDYAQGYYLAEPDPILPL